MTAASKYIPRLQARYNEQREALQKKLGVQNAMGLPRLEKIVVNMGVGRARENRRILDLVSSELAVITGQKAAIAKAKIAEAGFKLKQGDPIGCYCTLRGSRMWDFADRLISVALPRVKDFRGVSVKAFDRAGNYSLGVSDQMIFVDLNLDRVEFRQGMSITFVFRNSDPVKSRAFMDTLGMPFQRPEEQRRR